MRRSGRHSRWLVPAALLAGLVALGIAVDAGELHSIDRYGFQHLQPLRGSGWRHLTDPVEAPVAALLMAIALLGLRARRPLAVAWAAAFAASFAIELIGKSVIERPFANPSHSLWTVQGSFPSGHTMRAVVVAGALAAAWPQYRRALLVWAAATALLVELTGMHVISEVAGGLLAGLALVTAVWAWRLESPPRGRAAFRRRRARRPARRARARSSRSSVR